MKYSLPSLLIAIIFLVSACLPDMEAPRNAPDAPTIKSSDLTRVAVTLTGTYPRGADVTEYGFQWSQDGFETYKTEQNPRMTDEGTFTWTPTFLTPSTSYLFRSYISNGISTRYSTNLSVKTEATSRATLKDVTIRDGYVTASIVDSGGRKIVDIGFLCAETDNMAELKRGKRHWVKVGTSDTFSKSLSSFDPPLEPGKTYYFIAYAEDETDAFGYSPTPQEYVVTTIRLDKSSIEFSVGDSQTLTARFLPEGTPSQPLTWTSSNEEIATVTQEGVVTGVGSGTCIVKVMSGGLSDSCEVSVNAIPVERITLDQSSAQMLSGATMTLRATIEPENATDKTVTWTSSDEEIAKVSQDGVVTAVGLGSCTITAKAGEKTVSCEIMIGVPVTSVSFDESEREVYVGENFTLTANIAPADATDKTIVWKSSDETVATVSQDGAIGPKSPGTATISAAATSGAAASFDCIVVSEAPVFPDENFRKYVYENFDTNSDGFLSRNEALSVERISVSTDEIESLKGIESFSFLKTLICEGTGIEGSQGYDYYYTSNGKLTDIDVTSNSFLDSLLCCHNNLSTISLNPSIHYVYCQCNYLHQIDLSHCSQLIVLDCECNELAELDISHNTDLSVLWCGKNNISHLDISKCVNLKSLLCDSNKLTNLDVRNNNLQYLVFSNNMISTIDISTQKELSSLSCDVNPLESISTSNNPYLESFSCEGNGLSKLDISSNVVLKTLNCPNNRLTTLDVSNNLLLELLNCCDNNLDDLDISRNSNIRYLQCDDNHISSLNVSGQPSLYLLTCTNNNLSSLDVSNNLELFLLACNQNSNLYEIWLQSGQTIERFIYDTSITTIKYKN